MDMMRMMTTTTMRRQLWCRRGLQGPWRRDDLAEAVHDPAGGVGKQETKNKKKEQEHCAFSTSTPESIGETAFWWDSSKRKKLRQRQQKRQQRRQLKQEQHDDETTVHFSTHDWCPLGRLITKQEEREIPGESSEQDVA